MSYEEKLLKLLVEQYRSSKKDGGKQKIARRTQMKPEKLYKKYTANDCSMEELEALHQAVALLEQQGIVEVQREAFGTQILRIYLVDEAMEQAEQRLVQQYGYVSKDMQLEAVAELIQRYGQSTPICSAICMNLQEQVSKRQVPRRYEELGPCLKAIAFLEQNREWLYYREASMKIYGSSKYLEEYTLEQVCTMLRQYTNQPVQEGELLDEILQQFYLQKEPQKLCIKGEITITVGGREIPVGVLSDGIELTASSISQMQQIRLGAAGLLTVENYTTYLRYQESHRAVLYLGGYANRHQRDFLKKIYQDNPMAAYQHFGDLDAGGFWIHHHLCKITDIPFGLFAMSVEQLEDPAYTACLQPLTNHDRDRLAGLEHLEAYRETVGYMLQNNCKLEQEIISLELMRHRAM